MQWAMTQNNLGGALRRLGEREDGTMQFEAAIAAYNDALEVFVAADAIYYAEVCLENRDRAVTLLNERSGLAVSSELPEHPPERPASADPVETMLFSGL
jgi:hypothetical protein